MQQEREDYAECHAHASADPERGATLAIVGLVILGQFAVIYSLGLLTNLLGK